MIAIYILASYLLLTAADILLCLTLLERAMRPPRHHEAPIIAEPLWTC